MIFEEVITGIMDFYGLSFISRKYLSTIVILGNAKDGGYPIGLVIVNDLYTIL